MGHADRDNDGNGWAQARAETLRGSISPIWLIPFSLSSLLILQDNNRWLGANNTANLSARCSHLTLSCTDPCTQATVGHINILLRTAQGQTEDYLTGYKFSTYFPVCFSQGCKMLTTLTKSNQAFIEKYHLLAGLFVIIINITNTVYIWEFGNSLPPLLS